MQNEAKIDKKLIYMLIIALVVLVIALMLPNNKNAKYTGGTTTVLSERDKSNCKQWIEDVSWKQVKLKQVKGENHTTSLNEHNLSIVGKFTQGWKESTFTCIKNLDGEFGKLRNWLFVLEIDGVIVAQDI